MCDTGSIGTSDAPAYEVQPHVQVTAIQMMTSNHYQRRSASKAQLDGAEYKLPNERKSKLVVTRSVVFKFHLIFIFYLELMPSSQLTRAMQKVCLIFKTFNDLMLMRSRNDKRK